MSQMINLSLLDKQEKELKSRLDTAKKDLEQAMKEHDIKSIDNDYIKATITKASETISVDLKELKEEEPETYQGLIEDYPKITKRKAFLYLKVK